MTDVISPVETPAEEPVVQDSNDIVSYDTHKKLLDEKKKIQAKLMQYEQREKKAQEELLLKEGKLQEALALKDKELEEERNRLRSFEQRDIQAKKLSAVVKGLGTSDLDDKWFTIIGNHIDEVDLDDDGRINQGSLMKVIESLKSTWPEMIKKPMPGMPNGKPMGTQTTISREDWTKLPSSEMKKWKLNQII
jgi:hypothetical protein